MAASFTLELDTTPPEMDLTAIDRTETEISVSYVLSELGDALAQFVVDGTEEVIVFTDHGDRVSGLVPSDVGGQFTIRGRDLVWNEAVRSFHMVPAGFTPGEFGRGRISEARTGHGRIRKSGGGRLS